MSSYDRAVTQPVPGARKELRQPGLVVYLCGFAVSAAVLYAVSDLAGFTTGTVIEVDGGG